MELSLRELYGGRLAPIDLEMEYVIAESCLCYSGHTLLTAWTQENTYDIWIYHMHTHNI